ncbi:hypothetical protein [Halopelagius longus]|uniref:Uncharacterized protein n=1 Tax=Halopelagius longus TaxID=1236180 RepID=A0A1H1EU54_9EURY|nr:hypothetical protein [Halopelagius longus]RDI71890.1 hypothetical protein DWB78_09245 [Halopelagius longus]SDQ92277.1 hypothetical protein SAMN05216278_3066 [Halopelagius longus]
MRLRNRRGEAVDPVPFLVVSGLGLMLCVSFGPLYVAALGLSWTVAVCASAAASVGVTAGAYYRLVWTGTPLRTAEIPPEFRLRRMLYAGVALGLLFCLLSLPLL